MEYIISTDKTRLNIRLIHDFLCNRSYWAKGRTLEEVNRTIENSICFGLYHSDGQMLGFARVITDRVAFAYLMDVFILEEVRGRGLGKMLVNYIIDHPDLQVRSLLLATKDAHELYRKLGFSDLENPGRFLEIRRDEVN